MGKKNTLVFIPTFNEKENVERLYEGIKSLGLELDVLFVDDNSPDGTGFVLDELATKNANVKVIHRKGKLGIGSAHQAGIKWAYENKYSQLITMDCDFTHPPEYIPELLKQSKDFDVVVGSRYLHKDSLAEWNLFRKTLTRAGHVLTTVFLKMPYDATGAFRLYNLNKIPDHAFTLVSSKGYSFFYESLYILHLNGFSIDEIPIDLPARTYGHSKMALSDAWNSFKFLFSIYINTLVNRERFEVSEPFVPTGNTAFLSDNQGWDDYWNNQKSVGGLVYEAVAAFYRKFIIKRTLNYFIKKHFAEGSRLLHAGCGGGQVDTDIREYASITGLDISVNALNIYKKIHKDKCQILHGSIFAIPLPDASMDGIYNLGVMEHFTETDIQKILKEFHRVVKPGGKLVMFWPPEFGLSVTFFKGLKFIMEKIFRKKGVKFHPDEITRVRSKKHVTGIVEGAGFGVVEYYFGVRDFFTYSIIIARK